TGVKVRVTGREHLDPNQTYVFVANHQSYLDAAPLFAFTGRKMGAIAKKELLNAPILGYGMGWVNVIAIDRSNRDRAVETLKIATERLRNGISFGVCPEGTRAKPGEMLPFKKGAFHMAVQTGVPIVPMAIKNAGELMPRGACVAWPGTIELVMMPPVDTSWVKTDEDLDELVRRVQKTIMDELGIEKLSRRKIVSQDSFNFHRHTVHDHWTESRALGSFDGCVEQGLRAEQCPGRNHFACFIDQHFHLDRSASLSFPRFFGIFRFGQVNRFAI